MNAKERLEAWRIANEWERRSERTYPRTEDLLDWLADALAFSRAATPPHEVLIEERVARITRRKQLLSSLRS